MRAPTLIELWLQVEELRAEITLLRKRLGDVELQLPGTRRAAALRFLAAFEPGPVESSLVVRLAKREGLTRSVLYGAAKLAGVRMSRAGGVARWIIPGDSERQMDRAA